jgi:hypothetical protein
LVGDFEKAFLMIAEEDRDVLTFLWFDDITKDDPQIMIHRFTRVAFGVTASPFLLNGTIKHHIEKYHEEDPDFVQNFLTWMHDLSLGAKDDNAVYKLY